mmetsp:Transcript_27203/g.33010  ORF Transcript_27203/g.33010 Transcript_27203/m.33010 type:complete len:270 (+) Transcript_27203:68-877(+)
MSTIFGSDTDLAATIAAIEATDVFGRYKAKILDPAAPALTAPERTIKEKHDAALAERARRDAMIAAAAALAGASSASADEYPSRAPLPGAQLTFKDEKGKEDLSAKRSWETADQGHGIMYAARERVAKALKGLAVPAAGSEAEKGYKALEEAEKGLSEGMDLFTEKARLAGIAFKKSWAVARKLEGEELCRDEAEAKKLKTAEKEVEAEKKNPTPRRQYGNPWGGGQGGKGKGGKGKGGQYRQTPTYATGCHGCGSMHHRVADCPNRWY